MSNLVQRVLTSAVLVVITVAAILSGYPAFLLLIIALNILGLIEFYRLTDQEMGQRRLIAILFTTGILLITALVCAGVCPPVAGLWFIPVGGMIFISELFRKAKEPFFHLAMMFLGMITITFPLFCFVMLAWLPVGGSSYPDSILAYFVIVWVADTAAYFTGKVLGKHHLFPRISPGKTWEGSIGGAASALLVTFLICRMRNDFLPEQWLVIACIIIITGTGGDLVKSMLKRSVGVKDAGNLLPGHGGILDRFDSLLGSAPFVFFYIILSGHG